MTSHHRGPDDEFDLGLLNAVSVVRSGLSPTARQRLRAQHILLRQSFGEVVRNLAQPPARPGAAKEIMGDAFISPQRLSRAYSGTRVRYSDSLTSSLEKTLPPVYVLKSAVRQGFSLLPAPPEPMSYNEIRALSLDHFYYRNAGTQMQTAYALEITSPGWLLINGQVPNSFQKDNDTQTNLLLSDECMPSIAEVAWLATAYGRCFNTPLFAKGTFVRTSSIVNLNERLVCIGRSKSGSGIVLDLHTRNAESSPRVGMAVRKILS